MGDEKFQSPDEDSFTPEKVTKLVDGSQEIKFQSPDEDSFTPERELKQSGKKVVVLSFQSPDEDSFTPEKVKTPDGGGGTVMFQSPDEDSFTPERRWSGYFVRRWR